MFGTLENRILMDNSQNWDAYHHKKFTNNHLFDLVGQIIFLADHRYIRIRMQLIICNTLGA